MLGCADRSKTGAVPVKIENHPYDRLVPGQTARVTRLITPDDLYVFAAASGNYNPMHLPGLDGDGDGRPDNVAPGMFMASLISGVLGTLLPGPGTLYRSQSLTFHNRAHAGDEVVCTVTVTDLLPPAEVRLTTEVTRPADGALILTGSAVVTAPTRPFTASDVEVPGLIVQRHRHFDAILARAAALPPMATAVVCPHDANALAGALRAMEQGLIRPILIGDPPRIAAMAAELGADLSGLEVEAATGDSAASAAACALVHQGRVAAVMKGHLHTDDLLRPMLDPLTGLRIGRRLTHAFVLDVPGQPHPVIVTDAAINIAPDLAAKVDIVQNAIDLCLSLGQDLPRVGVLSAVETVNPAIQSSIDAALLSKMAERGQIRGGVVDGPLAMDNAVDMQAARVKGLTGEVAGRANILVVPGIDAGNMLVKQLAFMSHAEAAGVVLGAKVPVILTSRADGAKARLVSCAVAALHQARWAKGR